METNKKAPKTIKDLPARKVIKAMTVLGAVVGLASMVLSTTESKAYCIDRENGMYPNTGYCTVESGYNGGQQFCKPGGWTCDGEN